MYSRDMLVVEKTIRPNKVFNNIATSFSQYFLTEPPTEGKMTNHGLEKYGRNLDSVLVNKFNNFQSLIFS